MRAELVAAVTGLALASGCGAPDDASPGRARARAGVPGGVGSFAIVSVGGVKKLYLPRFNGKIAVLDVGAPGDGVHGAKALLSEIPLGGEGVRYATTTAGDSSIVVAASTQSPFLWFIDPMTDEVIDEQRLDSSYGSSVFAGNGGYVTAVAIDPAHGRAILAVWNGFAVVDLATRNITRIIEAPPSENFALDPAHGRLVAPFYDCASSMNQRGETPAACGTPTAPDGSPMTDGVSVVELDEGTVYTYENEGAADPSAPVGQTPISAAIDGESGLAVVPSKDRLYQSILDLSRARLDDRTHRVTAPQAVLRGNGLPVVAVATPTHLVFWEGANAADIAAGRLPSLAPTTPMDAGAKGEADAGATEPDYVFGLMPALPDGTPWMNLTTSHGIALWPGDASGGAFGVTVSRDYHWVARVDLATLLDLPAEYHETADVSPAVSFLDARSAP